MVLLFRAWDVDEKCWIPPDQIAITADSRVMTKTDDGRWVDETIPIDIIMTNETRLIYRPKREGGRESE